MDEAEIARRRAEDKECCRRAGHVIAAVWLALEAAGEPRPRTERITTLLGPDGEVRVRFGHTPLRYDHGFDLEPGERLYQLLDDDTGIYERSVPQPGITAHREIRFDGSIELRVDAGCSPN